MAMGGDCCRRQVEIADPARKNEGEGVVLSSAVAGVPGVVVGPFAGSLQADVQGKVVD